MSKSDKKRESAAPPQRELPAWIAFCVLAAAVWAVYARALDAPWIFDDSLSVLQNRSITSLWPLVGDAEHPGPFRPLIENPMSARPLVNATLALNFQLGSFDPRGYRAVNVLLHLSSAMLLWAFTWRTLRLPYFGGQFNQSAKWLALGVALLWSLHPLVTEAVVYVTQRTELMVALFYLATLYASLRYWTAESPGSRKVWLVAATLASLAGAASKEVMVSAPLVVLLFDWTFFGPSSSDGRLREIWRRSWPLYVALAASWLVIAGLQIGTPRSESAGFGLGIPLLNWWWTQAAIFVMYLKLALWPNPLVIHYALPQLESFATAWPYVLAVAAIVVATLVLLWRRHPAGWLLASVLLILAPTHLVPIGTEIAAERRMYLPLAALVALAVVGSNWLLVHIAKRPNDRWPLVAVGASAILVAALYAVKTARRVETFRDPIALWQENVALQPYNHVAQMNLAALLAAAGNQREALAHYREALRAKPDFVEGRYQFGLALAADRQYDEAIVELREVVRREPDAYKIRNNLGVILFSAGRLPEAIAEFEKTLEIRPDFVEARDNLNRARRAGVLPKKPE
jgi:cytochrome c-type biogenesis protein CcmH/NrfG